MRALVTGITGCVGSHLADLLLARGHVVWGTARWRSSRENLAHLPPGAVTLVECDLTDPWSVLTLLGKSRPEVIYHVAAQSYVPASSARPLETLSANGGSTINLLEAVRTLWPSGGDPVVHVCSSSEVYGRVSAKDCPIRETQPFAPLSPYALSKCVADAAAGMYWRSHGLQTVRTRAFPHGGPRRGRPFFDSNFCWQVARMERGLQSSTLRVGNMNSVRTLCDVRDMVRAYAALAVPGNAGEVFNVGGDDRLTVGEVVDLLREVSGVDFDVAVAPERIRRADADLQVPDTSRMRTLTGWAPTIPYRQTLTDMLAWWRGRPAEALWGVE